MQYLVLTARTNEDFEFVRDFHLVGLDFPVDDLVWDCHFRRRPDAATIDLAFSSSDDSISLAEQDNDEKIATMSLFQPMSAVQTMNGLYYFDIRFTRDGVTTVVVEGECTFRVGPTR